MASLNGLISQGKSFQLQPQKAYLSTGPFNTKLLTYSTSVNPTTFQTVGTLTPNANATAANCPANRVLHTNGRVLVPGANPGVTSPLIGVYDPISALNGFIDPTDPTFANYNTNMPYQYNLGISSVIATLGGTGANLRAGTDSGTIRATTENGGVNAGNASIGEFYFSTSNGRNSTIYVSSTQVLPTSRIFLTQVSSVFSTLTVSVPPVPAVVNTDLGGFRVALPAPMWLNDVRGYNFIVL